MKPPGPIRFVHYQPAHQTMSNNTPIQAAMEAARPAVQNWSLLEEVVSLLLSLLVFVLFFAHPRPWRVFRELGAIATTALSEAESLPGGR